MLSLCLIVKDEAKVIERCINSVREFLSDVIDDIVVVDTGSTDGTKQKVEMLGCCVFDFEWCNDFAKARNFSVSKAKNDWILVLDADEFVTKCSKTKLIDFMVVKNECVIGEIDIVNYGDFEGVSYTMDLVPRVFNRKNVEYVGIIHEMPAMKNGSNPILKKLELEIHHTGYIDEVAEEKGKADRNIEMLTKVLEKEEDLYLTMQLGKSYIRKREFIKAIECFEKVVFNEDVVQYEYYSKSVSEYVRCLLNVNQFEAAMVCESFWARCYGHDSYIYYMAHAYFRSKHYEKAIDCFLELLNRKEAEISKVMVYYSLGQLFATVEMYEESLTYFELCNGYASSIQNIEEIKKLLV